MGYILYQTGESRPTLIVETTVHASKRDVAALRQSMYGRGCANGLIFDEEWCVILRDTFSSMKADSIKEEARIPLKHVLNSSGSSLSWQVERWLLDMAVDWNRALPDDPTVAACFLPDIVAAIAGSSVQPQANVEARP